MEMEERYRIFRRVSVGKLYTTLFYNNKFIDVVFADPNQSLLAEADFIYDSVFKKLLRAGSYLTQAESYQLLIEDGMWSTDEEQRIKDLESALKDLRKQLRNCKYKKIEQRALRTSISNAEKQIVKLHNQKNQLYSSTAEHFADKAKMRFILRKITTFNNKDLFDTPAFIDSLSVCYYRDHHISTEKIRMIARTDPWRTCWGAAKGTGTSLFNHASVEMTELQYSLVLWSKVYDFAFESMNRPSQDIIDKDEDFDAWYEAEIDRLESENNNSTGGAATGGNFGLQETFVMADAEGAPDVYGLNDPRGRRIIKQRQKVIEKKGRAEDTDVRDIKMHLLADMNKQASEAIRSR